jgi:hypothetical protein
MQSNQISLENIFSKHSAQCSIAHIREFLREFEAEFENILGCYSGAYGQLIYEKARGRKSREDVSLSLDVIVFISNAFRN